MTEPASCHFGGTLIKAPLRTHLLQVIRPIDDAFLHFIRAQRFGSLRRFLIVLIMFGAGKLRTFVAQMSGQNCR